MLRKCKNKSFHDYLFVAKRSSHKYCDLPECKKDRHRLNSMESSKRNNLLYKTMSPHITGKKRCSCGQRHNNYFDKCNSCREKILDQYDCSLIFTSNGRRNGMSMIGG